MRIGYFVQAASIIGAAIFMMAVLASAAEITYDTRGGNTTAQGAVEAPGIPEFTAVPEPMTMSLVGAALIGLGLWGRRKVRP
jgi:hypothetical protein